MLKYLVRRLLIFIPTLIIISLLAFLMTSNAPGDPVQKMTGSSEDSQKQSFNSSQEKLIRHKLGLDLPLFFFSITNAATPDTLYRLFDKTQHDAAVHLIYQYGNWQYISAFEQKLIQLQLTAQSQKALDTISNEKQSLNEIFADAHSLQSAWDDAVINFLLNSIQKNIDSISESSNLNLAFKKLSGAYTSMKSNRSSWKNYLPCIHLYSNNQYARWLFGDGNWITGKGSVYSKGILRGDFGSSYTTKLPVMDELTHRIPWSLFFTFISVLIAYAVSIPLGIKAASQKGNSFDQASTIIVFILYSLPGFWVATVLLMLFANPDVISLFPASGVGPPGGIANGTSLFEWLKLTIPHLILPTIAYTYSSFAFISRMLKVSMLEVLGQDFIRTAKAKGLSENKVVYKHAFRNSLLPIITMFANIFPAAVGGSVILETIFSIPGMGQEIYQAIFNQDYPVVIAVFTITGVLTLFAYILADIMYVLVDPRISFSNKSK